MVDSLGETVDLSTLERPAGGGTPEDTIELGATLAAPLPQMATDTAAKTMERSLRTTNSSVLPRVEPGEAGARLVPSDGRRYENVKTLGRGGMGEVALVEDRDIGRSVALKRMIAEAQGPAAVARFVDEVRTIGRLEHPNIVPIHDVGVDEHGQLFFVMKYVEGETLEAVIDRMRAGDAATLREYDATRCIEIFVGILRALQFAHERGLIHRDVKPANVMLGRFGEIVLMDWGVARPIGGAREGNAPAPELGTTTDSRASVTRVGSLIGTPLYMSPEQARGQNDLLDARSDLFTACVVFYELLNHGHHRFAGAANLPALLVAIQTTEPPGPATFFDHASVGPEFVHFLRRGLALAPEKRWQTASVMIEELHAILDGRIRIQCPFTLTKRVTREIGRFIDRSPMITIGLVVLTLLGVLGLAANAVRDLAAGF